MYRLHQALWPLLEGPSRIDAAGYSPWWGGHQLQVLYSAFPALRLVPGLYSAWLRLWGSRVGRAVFYWTPQVEITDRGLLKVGDGVVFGHRVVSIPKGVSTDPAVLSKSAGACSARSSPR